MTLGAPTASGDFPVGQVFEPGIHRVRPVGPNALVVQGLEAAHLGPLSFVADGVVVIRGVSGSGKTLLLRALADLDPHRGRVSLGPMDQTEMSAPEWRRRVGYLPAESAWWHATPKPHFGAKTGHWWRALGLSDDRLEVSIDRLSSGERQRLALARLLDLAPSALLLDEPDAHLDPESATRLRETIRTWAARRNATVLWVAHGLGPGRGAPELLLERGTWVKP